MREEAHEFELGLDGVEEGTVGGPELGALELGECGVGGVVDGALVEAG